MKLWKEFLENNSIKEDAPANSSGSGDIAGMGVDHPDRPGSGEPGLRFDGRTGPYRRHRKKLEDARQKREERKVAKEKEFAENNKNKTENVTFRTDAIRPGYPVASPMAALQNSNLTKKTFKKKKK